MSARAELSVADKAEVRRRYVGLGEGPEAITRALGGRAKLHQVKWLIAAEKLGALRSPEVRALMLARRTGAANDARREGEKGFFWGKERLAQLKQLYLVDLLPPSVIARRFGGRCTADGVKRKAYAMGWSALRAPVWPDPSPRGPRAASVLPTAPVRREVLGSAAPRVMPVDDAALIAEAIAAGRVTYCPTVAAAGLTAVEQQFWAARPPPREIAAQVQARARRAGRAGALFHAGRRAVA